MSKQSNTRASHDASAKAFARRLNQACDDHPNVPPFYSGRQSYVHKALKVSPEGTRKWFAGLTKPRPETMTRLARLLGVDEAWLSLGVTPPASLKERETRNAMAGGAVNIVAGFIQLDGGRVAFPRADDPQAEHVDLYVIIRGMQFSIHVSLGLETEDGSIVFHLPVNYADYTNIGVVASGPLQCTFLHLTQNFASKCAAAKSGHFEIQARKDGPDYRTGKATWPRIRNFRDNLVQSVVGNSLVDGINA